MTGQPQPNGEMTPIAIVGIGLVLPGLDGHDRDAFWRLVAAAKCCAQRAPAGRWLDRADALTGNRRGDIDRVDSTMGCFVEDFIFEADPFLSTGLDRAELEALDPLVHLVLTASRDAADTMLDPHLRARTGVVFGNIALPTDTTTALTRECFAGLFESQLLGTPPRAIETSTTNVHASGLPAMIVAHALGLEGPSYTLDAACASSLYAIELACRELAAGRADAMLAGGLSRPSALYTQMGFTQLRAISPSGTCAPFSRQGDGLVVGEGSAMFLLRRLDDAVADGSRILGVIRGIGLSNDMGGSLLAPDSEGQLRAMRQAYARAGWQPHDVDVIECHATGTPLGDAVEFGSLVELWRDADRASAPNSCVIGSVKSNVGHLLTGAGAAGLAKLLLAFENKSLPPTANFERLPAELDAKSHPFRVLKRAEQWSRRAPNTPRRAALSAFGFGGINAHLLIEEWLPTASPANADSDESPSVTLRERDAQTAIAIVGIDARCPGMPTLTDFARHALTSTRPDGHERPRWWNAEASGLADSRLAALRGRYFDAIEVPIGRYRIPPRELEEMLPQQLLMLDVAARALEDVRSERPAGERSALFIGLGLDLNTTNFSFRWSLPQLAREWARAMELELSDSEFDAWIAELQDAAGPPLTANRTMGALGGVVASRIAREFRFGASCFTVASEEDSGLRALELGVRALEQGDIDLALTGAVDFAGDLRHAIAHAVERPATPLGDGAAALVLKRLSDAERDGDAIYGVIRGLGHATARDSGALASALDRAHREAGWTVDSIDAVEGTATAELAELAGELDALKHFFASRHAVAPRIALGSTVQATGYCGAASSMLSIAKTALAIASDVLPSAPESMPTAEPFFAPTTAQYWLRDRIRGPRRAAVLANARGGQAGVALIEAYEHTGSERATSNSTSRRPLVLPISESSESVFALRAPDIAGLIGELDRVDRELDAMANDIAALAQDCHRRDAERATSDSPRRLAILASSADELRTLIDTARRHLRAAPHIALGRDGPARIFYGGETPLGGARALAFVYPGSGNHFLGMGRELSAWIPAALARQDAENAELRAQWHPDQFWNPTAASDLDNAEAAIFGQVALGTLVTDVLEILGVFPASIIGYSLGETAGLFSTRTWCTRDAMLERMRTSDLFTRELAGPCDAARRAWQLTDDAKVDWQIGVIEASRDEVIAALDGIDRVYLLIVNTKTECVIGGDRERLQQLRAGLERMRAGRHWHPISGVTTVHCEVAESVRQAYRALHIFPVTPPPGVRFYSGVHGAAYDVDTDSAADSILEQALIGFDYTKTIESAYRDGARVFIELGPGSSCTRMIAQILADRPHVARALCRRTEPAARALLSTVAQLFAEGIDVDFAPLDRERVRIGVTPNPQLRRLSVPVGGARFDVPRPPASRRRVERDTEVRPGLDPKSGFTTATSERIFEQFAIAERATLDSHRQYLALADRAREQMLTLLAEQQTRLTEQLVTAEALGQVDAAALTAALEAVAPSATAATTARRAEAPLFDYAECMEIAIGSIASVLGPEFAEVDRHPTRVRLPDEPLMLAHRILSIHGEPKSMAKGSIITEHDVVLGAWYLDGGRIPTCIAVEAGQADLFLSGYLGIDFHTRGLAVYRLLDAEVTFHDELPGPGKTIRYDIHIDEFFFQGDTALFRFWFEATCDGAPLLSMRQGCAGFFTQQELDAGQGIVKTALDLAPEARHRAPDCEPFIPMLRESYDDAQLAALRRGDLVSCFGQAFAALAEPPASTLPSGRMTLVHRILDLDPTGGRFGLGMICGEADIQPDDWFLTCHFSDDMVMPGTLMYECCLHTLRVFLMRFGWIGTADEVVHQPVTGVRGRLRCRGQVTEATSKVIYEITIKAMGYRDADRLGGGGEPYVIVDALMYADGKAVVDMGDMSLRLSGLTRDRLRERWSQAEGTSERRPAIFDDASITAFAIGKPSEAFGAPYAVFDETRVIARLPGPPYKFLNRISSIRKAEPFVLAAGAVIEAEYDVPEGEWYFAQNRSREMPFAVLLEVALQPCGWLAAYLGSALTSDEDLRFRNLGGRARQTRAVKPDVGTLSIDVEITAVSQSGGMVIQHFTFAVRDRDGVLYDGTTYFGFFTKQALANQIGIRDSALYTPDASELERAQRFEYPRWSPFPDAMLRRIDDVLYVAGGGPHGLGFARGTQRVEASEWFFAAHFYQDPVCPGSLGLEACLQLIKLVAADHFAPECLTRPTTGLELRAMALGETHEWVYRGQYIPSDDCVTVEILVTAIDDEARRVTADGYLSIDGRTIYQMKHFTVQLIETS